MDTCTEELLLSTCFAKESKPSIGQLEQVSYIWIIRLRDRIG